MTPAQHAVAMALASQPPPAQKAPQFNYWDDEDDVLPEEGASAGREVLSERTRKRVFDQIKSSTDRDREQFDVHGQYKAAIEAAFDSGFRKGQEVGREERVEPPPCAACERRKERNRLAAQASRQEKRLAAAAAANPPRRGKELVRAPPPPAAAGDREESEEEEVVMPPF